MIVVDTNVTLELMRPVPAASVREWVLAKGTGVQLLDPWRAR